MALHIRMERLRMDSRIHRIHHIHPGESNEPTSNPPANPPKKGDKAESNKSAHLEDLLSIPVDNSVYIAVGIHWETIEYVHSSKYLLFF